MVSNDQTERDGDSHGIKALLDAYVPPGVLFSPDGTIQRFFGDPDPFLISGKKPDFPNLLARLDEGRAHQLRDLMTALGNGPGPLPGLVFAQSGKNGERLHRMVLRQLTDGAPPWDYLLSFEAVPGGHPDRRKDMPRQLLENDQLLRAIIDNMPPEFLFKDLEGRYILVNRAFLGNRRLREEDVIGHTLSEIYSDEIASDYTGWDMEVLRSERAQIRELKMNFPGYPGKFVLSNKFPVYDVNGNLTGTATVNTDITELKSMREQLEEVRKEADDASRRLQQSEQLLRAVIDNAPSEILLKDLDGHYLLVNRAFLENHQVSEADVIGRTLGEMYSPQAYAPFREMELRLLETGESQIREVAVQLPDYPIKTVLSIKFPLYVEGELTAIGTINSDFTELRQATHRMKQAMLAAEKANKAKSEFLSAMSHELRTPLNAILGFGQLLTNLGEDLSERQADAVRQILIGGEHLLELINEILDLSRIESGHLAMESESIHIKTLLDASLDMSRGQAKNHEVALKDHCTCGEDVFVRGDGNRIRQVLLNLLSNAIKYNRPGGEVMLSCRSCGAGRVRFEVRDNGLGIPREKFSKVFEPFQRLGAENTNREGTGIGLTITKELVERMGGKIGFESEVGAGTLFWFELPQGDPVENTDIVETSDEAEPVNMAREGSTVIYVEDNFANRLLMKAVFEVMPGIRLLMAEDGESGLEMIRDQRPDLVLLDINLPGISGIEVAAQLQQDPETRDIPLVAISANAMEGDIHAAMRAGCQAYLTKPVNVEELNTLISSILS